MVLEKSLEKPTSQEVVDGDEVAERVDGSESADLVEELHAFRILGTVSVDVDGESNVSIIHRMVELCDLVTCSHMSTFWRFCNRQFVHQVFT